MLALREVYEKLKSEKKYEQDIMKELEKIDIKVSKKHFELALTKVRPSISQDMIKFYQQFEETFRGGMVIEKSIRERYYG